ncbi:MAG: ABC transporter ATP-binding protein [Erysipelotrichaceae bacterium]|jgi:peptide/nickel transport system ATP-binding protein|nr:ABC transporter ATP-binding protein [Erysipelotrichaceae bacterium]
MGILDIRNVNIRYTTQDGDVFAVKNANFTIEEQDAVGIVGESGSGKTTLAMAILQLLPGNAIIDGEIIYDGKNLLALSENELNKIRWDDISVVFQKSMSALSPVHKIGAQMEDVYRTHDSSISRAKLKEHVNGLLETVGLPERVYNMYAHELSGGMMQRVSIALSLLNNPKIVIFDEATTALDVVVQEKILNEILDLQEKFRLTRIMITHDISVVASTCNKVIVMYDGEILEAGDVDDVLLKPKAEYTKKLLNSYLNIV